VTITLDEAASRYEGRLGEEMVGEVDVVIRETTMIITHTGTAPAWRGRGVAGQLNEHVLTEARARGLSVRPDCPYTAGYIARHPEFADLVD